MTIDAYVLTCDARIVDKRTYLSEHPVELKGETRDNIIDVVNPVILVSSEAPIDCNYAYIAAFGRYYFVRVSVIRAGLYALSMHCDVLMSYRTQIAASKAVARRTKDSGENGNINLYVKDGDLPMFAYTEDTVHVIGSFADKWSSGAYVCTVG